MWNLLGNEPNACSAFQLMCLGVGVLGRVYEITWKIDHGCDDTSTTGVTVFAGATPPLHR